MLEETTYQDTVHEIASTSPDFEQGVRAADQDNRPLYIAEGCTGQILNLGYHGLSFGCLFPQSFPDQWLMDVIDVNGTWIQKIRVRKMWECFHGPYDDRTQFAMTVGVEFDGITPHQSRELASLLGKHEGFACVSTLIICQNVDSHRMS